MSNLSNKILTYSPEQFVRFNTAYSTSPTNLGSGGTGTWTLSNENPTLNASGGPDSEGSWEFNWGGNSDTTITRFRISTSTNVLLTPEITDASFCLGFWFKFTLPNALDNRITSSVYTFALVRTKSLSCNFAIGSASDRAGRFAHTNAVSGLQSFTSNRVDDGNWHYAAIRVNETSSGVVDIDTFLDGVQIGTSVGKTFTPGTLFEVTLGNTTQLSMTGDVGKMEFSNLHITPYSTIDATAISEIWTAGFTSGGTNITINETPATATALQVLPTISRDTNNLETPATASALMTEPTIAITANNHTEITTSILVSATFPSNIVFGADKNVNISVTEILTASTELINNVIVNTGTDDSFSAAEFTASATLVKPFISEQPFIASATMPNAVASVTPNYYSLVKALNPYLYVYDGKGNPTNRGYQTGTFTKDLGLGTLRDLGNPLNIVGEGKSWYGEADNQFSSADKRMQFTTATNAQSFDELVSTGTFAWEAWVKPPFLPNGVSDPTLFFVRGPIRIALVPQVQNPFPAPNTVPKVRIEIADSPTTFKTFEINRTSTPFSGNNWAHVVVQSYDDGTANTRRIELWINGTRYITQQYSYSDWVSTTNTSIVFGSDYATLFGTPIMSFNNIGIDEVAIYSQALTNSQIVNHYNFISTLSPNVIFNVDPLLADAESANHVVAAIQNAIIPETPVTATGLLVNPSILAVKNISTSATALTASAQNTDATVYWGWTIYATPVTAYAERPESYFLNDLYYQYVQTNITPYRYVTFDAADGALDYGTDNDYSVTPTTIGGTVVNPDLGINGKSVKTTGSSYVTDGVILNESEWNDSWGTGQNSYHSAFWFQRALDDNSTTGLRVLWNLNGYKDNQHVVLYQYQGKLHMQFNNGSGTWIEQDTGSLDLFDYQRHFVVIEFDHTNPVQNTVRLYVDSILKMTVLLGAYTGETTNASSADSGPNTEANNRPRLSVGCLITPFASTALPVQPTNTKLIVDEIYWDKNSINQTMVTNLYNAMPDKNNKIVMVEPFLASDELVMPAFSTSSIVVVVPLAASVEFVEPVIIAVRNIVTIATVLTASAESVDALVFENKIIVADVFVATAIFDSPGVVITIPGGPMTAHAFMRDDAVYLNEWNILVLSQTYKQLSEAASANGKWMIGDIK